MGLFINTGVSGSGKSTLISDILYGSLKKRIDGIYSEKIGMHTDLKGFQQISSVELVDQTPIGRSPRSNPVTYLKIFDMIRELYGALPSSKLKSYSPGSFSFNIPGGRCETCEGSGVIKIAMQFMADIYLECDTCKGKVIKAIFLKSYNGKNISDVLEMSISNQLFFKEFPKIT
jgi:excinuclease ABC subunit A